MLFDQSEEHDLHNGIGLISGIVSPIPKQSGVNNLRKIPSIGWNKLIFSESGNGNWNKTCLSNINPEEYFYFVHSFMSKPKNNMHSIAQYKYEGIDIVAAVQKDNITGVQFHPEKSGNAGLKILENFIKG